MLPHAAVPQRAAAIVPSNPARLPPFPAIFSLVNPQGSQHPHQAFIPFHRLSRTPDTHFRARFPSRYPLVRTVSSSRALPSRSPAFRLQPRRPLPLRHAFHGPTQLGPAASRASGGGRSGGGADADEGEARGGADREREDGGVAADADDNNDNKDNNDPVGGFWKSVSSAMQSMADAVTQTQRELLEGEYSAGTPWLDDDDVSLLHSQITPYNFVKVVEVSRRADNSLAGSRVLLLDQPGNIHSMYFKYKPWTDSYYDLFTLLPPLLPPGPIAILGLAAGTGARLLLRHYPHLELHGWEIDDHVIQVARSYFDLEELEDGSFAAQQLRPYVPFSDSDSDTIEGDCIGEEETERETPAPSAGTTEADTSHVDGVGRLVVHCGDALSTSATVLGGFAGIIVDLYSRGAVVAPLQQVDTWRALSGRLHEGGKILVNCGGGCVEGDESVQTDGEAIMLATLEAMAAVFPPEAILCHRVGDEDGEDDESDDTEWDGNVMVLAGHDSMPWPLVPSVVSSPSPLSLPSLVPSPSPSSPSLSSPSVSSPSPSVLHLREVVGAEERAQVEGGAAGAWEEEWGARVPGELRGKVRQWMPLDKFVQAQEQRRKAKAAALLR
ncbi:hypothetical protein CLOM_g21596 [Closterium sp. NIES-68]|nr:hypothetical protein CLOM_g21596 [Closterium sp. NIES-68]GJP68641.1 hypothetical protein CLOP_g25314 [Closterium sp. NIES-67]